MVEPGQYQQYHFGGIRAWDKAASEYDKRVEEAFARIPVSRQRLLVPSLERFDRNEV